MQHLCSIESSSVQSLMCHILHSGGVGITFYRKNPSLDMRGYFFRYPPSRAFAPHKKYSLPPMRKSLTPLTLGRQ